MSERRQVIIIDSQDNVATAIQNLAQGSRVPTERGEITLLKEIPFGHKFALEDMASGDYVYKYGAAIGRATEPIRRGDHVHVHNVEDITDEVRKEV
jgi:altronate dehydratase small subunit